MRSICSGLKLGLSRIVPAPLPRACARTPRLCPRGAKVYKAQESSCFSSVFSKVYLACHQYNIPALQTRPLHLYVESCRFSAQKCTRYQKHVIPLPVQSVIRSTQQQYGKLQMQTTLAILAVRFYLWVNSALGRR